jgi:phosphoglycerol transferase MdoB-like AlkP superfamily enzyme
MNLKNLMHHLFKGSYAPAVMVFLVFTSLSFLTRLALLLFTLSAGHFSAAQVVYAFFTGFLYDACVGCFVMIPFVLQVATAGEKAYTTRLRWVLLAGFVLILFIFQFTTLIPKEYSKELYYGIELYIALRFAIYLLLLKATPAFRNKWRRSVLFAGFFFVVFLLVFNAVSEWFFWEEFSARYNFIAVDYLIYTTEVIGNINESYPIALIIGAVALATLGITLLVRKNIAASVTAPHSLKSKLLGAVALLALPVIAFTSLSQNWMQKSDNSYANELAGNGLYTFTKAFLNNELDFFTYYQTIDNREAFRRLRAQLSGPNVQFTGTDSLSIERDIRYNEPANRMNVVLISVESLSATFMKAFGNNQNLTPKLDSLAQHSIFFTNFYASGTRTVRGLEAITLSLPPTPGQSTVKRPDNANLFSLGAVLRNKGYITQYIYGGYSYFDNMKEFFGNNGYDVIDREALKPQEVHYSNVWGVADEDLFGLSLRTLDSNYATGQPFFSHIMTVSNHRPFTYPEGRIDIPPATQCREGAVKYTDYAIGKFIEDARRKPWFSNTIFVIVADHCASSAGSTELPVTGYHIPLLIYSPAHLQPQRVDRLTAQIDIAPTVMGLLKESYRSKFFGEDVFAANPSTEQRAIISTYQGLGFISHNQLVVQSPVRKVNEFIPDFATGESRKTTLNDSLRQEAIAYYQCASYLLKHKQYNFKKHTENLTAR